jgi:hypothetical protein
MLKTPFLFVMGFVLASSVSAGTIDLLQGQKVRGSLTLVVPSKAGNILYRVDADPDNRTLEKNTSFLISNQVAIQVENFNPLKMALVIKDIEEVDVNFGPQLSEFFDKLLVLGTTIRPSADQTKKSLESMQFTSAPPCEPAVVFNDLFSRTIRIVSGVPDTDKQIRKDLAATTGGRNGSLAFQASLASQIDTLGNNAQAIDSELATLKSALDTLLANPACSSIASDAQARFLAVKAQGDAAKAALATISDQLKVLKKDVEAVTDPEKWNSAGTSYIAHRATLLPDKQRTVTVTVTLRDVNDRLGGPLLLEKGTVEGSMVLHNYSLFIPEVAAGVVYSDQRYPKYGTKEEGGVMKVARASEDGPGVEAALMLNLICRCWGRNIFYPSLQLGLSSAKDVPGLLFGLGFRFTQPRQLSLTGGRMLTWAKDLDKLKVGDVVSGTAALESDLKLKRQPTAWYVAVQYSF